MFDGYLIYYNLIWKFVWVKEIQKLTKMDCNGRLCGSAWLSYNPSTIQTVTEVLQWRCFMNVIKVHYLLNLGDWNLNHSLWLPKRRDPAIEQQLQLVHWGSSLLFLVVISMCIKSISEHTSISFCFAGWTLTDTQVSITVPFIPKLSQQWYASV